MFDRTHFPPLNRSTLHPFDALGLALLPASRAFTDTYLAEGHVLCSMPLPGLTVHKVFKDGIVVAVLRANNAVGEEPDALIMDGSEALISASSVLTE
jgi:hypothetical protein